MTEQEYEEIINYNFAINAKEAIKKLYQYLTNEDTCELVNKLITFENSHIIANCFNDDKISYALYQELKIKYENS